MRSLIRYGVKISPSAYGVRSDPGRGRYGLDAVAPRSYHGGMSSVVKKSISVPDDVWSAAEAAAEDEHTTVSALVSEALSNLLAVRAGLRSVRDWERDHGSLTAEELAEADALLTNAGVTTIS